MAEAASIQSPAEDDLKSLSDCDLLNRFCESGDEAGFRAIVERHAAMVSSVCLSVLRNNADAEDAFQATFFILARKARTVRERKSLGAWLHRVALRSALVARRKRMARPATELPPEETLPESALRKITTRAAVSTMHEELDRLPEKYRSVLIACYLEGSSRKEAAARFDLTEAAVKTRLERARRMLRRRMGVLGFAAFSAVGLCQSALAAGAKAMSAATMTSTVSIATQVKYAWSKTLAAAAGNQASLTLAQGVLKTMLIGTTLKASATALFGLLAGVLAMTAITLADDPPNPAVVQTELQNKAEETETAETTLVVQEQQGKQDDEVTTVQQVIERAVVSQPVTVQSTLSQATPSRVSAYVREVPAVLQSKEDYFELTVPREQAQEVVTFLQERTHWRPLHMVTRQEDGKEVAEIRMIVTQPEPVIFTQHGVSSYRVVDRLSGRIVETRPSRDLATENKELQARVTELEEALNLRRRIEDLESENARLRARIRQLENDDNDED